jgi:hypothetical protein
MSDRQPVADSGQIERVTRWKVEEGYGGQVYIVDDEGGHPPVGTVLIPESTHYSEIERLASRFEELARDEATKASRQWDRGEHELSDQINERATTWREAASLTRGER